MDLPPAEPLAFTATAKLVTGRSLLRGLSVRETGGVATAQVTVRDGGTSGIVMVVVTLAGGESMRDWFGGAGLLVERDVQVVVDSGAVSGSCWVTPESRYQGFSFPSEWFEGYQ